MTIQAILLPVFVQVALVFALVILMGARRVGAAKAGAVRREDVSLGQQESWPAQARQAANAYANQFELPVLFFALVPLSILTRKADLAFVVMSWLFVVSRLVHAVAYVTVNNVPVRFVSFLAGVLLLFTMWAMFAVGILSLP